LKASKNEKQVMVLKYFVMRVLLDRFMIQNIFFSKIGVRKMYLKTVDGVRHFPPFVLVHARAAKRADRASNLHG
jgi:hypothetical protein